MDNWISFFFSDYYNKISRVMLKTETKKLCDARCVAHYGDIFKATMPTAMQDNHHYVH